MDDDYVFCYINWLPKYMADSLLENHLPKFSSDGENVRSKDHDQFHELIYKGIKDYKILANYLKTKLELMESRIQHECGGTLDAKSLRFMAMARCRELNMDLLMCRYEMWHGRTDIFQDRIQHIFEL